MTEDMIKAMMIGTVRADPTEVEEEAVGELLKTGIRYTEDGHLLPIRYTEDSHLLPTLVVEDTDHVPDLDHTHLVAIKA